MVDDVSRRLEKMCRVVDESRLINMQAATQTRIQERVRESQGCPRRLSRGSEGGGVVITAEVEMGTGRKGKLYSSKYI